MQIREENKFTMFRTVNGHLVNNPTVVDSIPVFRLSADLFEAKLMAIADKNGEYLSLTAGKTILKDEAEDALVGTLLGLASTLSLFAEINGKRDLQEIVNITESSLRRMRDTDLLNKGQEIVSHIEINKDDLDDFGITDEVLAKAKGCVELYDTSLNLKETSFAEKKAARQVLKDLFSEADDILYNRLDKCAEMVRQNYPEFYIQYQATRVIKDLGIRHTGGSDGE